jgi:hypothetical protein
VRLVAATFVRWRRARPPRARAHRHRQFPQRLAIAGQPAPQHVRPRRAREGARARQAEAEREVPPGRALKPRLQPAEALLAYLAEEGERDMPQLTACPPQVLAPGPQWRARRVEVVEHRRGRREADEKPHQAPSGHTLNL